jgi:hypothetical protein
MSYLTGSRLEQKIKEYGLTELDKYLASLLNTKICDWAGECVISCSAEHLERIRIVLYSMVHKNRLKKFLSVKMLPFRKVCIVDLKTKYKIACKVNIPSSSAKGE